MSASRYEIVNGTCGNGTDFRPNVLTVGKHDQLVTTAAQRLYEDGYRGPFGIDAFAHRLGGERVLYPRHAVGHVARALGERFGAQFARS